MSYRGEKFALAIEMLASGSGRIQERLMNAVAHNSLLDLGRKFQDDLSEQYLCLKNELCKIEDSLEATIEKMSSEKASELTGKIVSLFCEICKRDY